MLDSAKSSFDQISTSSQWHNSLRKFIILYLDHQVIVKRMLEPHSPPDPRYWMILSGNNANLSIVTISTSRIENFLCDNRPSTADDMYSV